MALGWEVTGADKSVCYYHSFCGILPVRDLPKAKGISMEQDSVDQDILKKVREAAGRRILFLPHALGQMNTPERMISTQEVRQVVLRGAVIED